MATTLQHRRGTASEAAAFTGAPGEFFIDTENKLVYLHDGTTVGGKLIGPQNVYTKTEVDTITGDIATLLNTINGEVI